MSNHAMIEQLSRACSNGNIEAVEAMVQNGFSLSQLYDFKGRHVHGNALHAFAAVQHTSYELSDVKLLECFIRHGAGINTPNKDGLTPLHVAVGVDDLTDAGVALVHDLHRHGAELDARDKLGRTPLHVAMTAGNIKAFKALCDLGARLDIVDKQGNSCTEFWKSQSHEGVTRISIEPTAGYRLTEIFNFGNRSYYCMAQNARTKAEAITVMPLDQMADTELMSRALTVLEREQGSSVAKVVRKPGLKVKVS